jgi:hypothetical protein
VQKASSGLGVTAQLAANAFEGYPPLEFGILGAVDFPHPSDTQLGADDESAYLATG